MSIHKVVDGKMTEIASNTSWDAETKTLSIDGVKCFSLNDAIADSSKFLTLNMHKVEPDSDGKTISIDHDGYLFGYVSYNGIPLEDADRGYYFGLVWFRKSADDLWQPLTHLEKVYFRPEFYVKKGYQFIVTTYDGNTPTINVDEAKTIYSITLNLFYDDNI